MTEVERLVDVLFPGAVRENEDVGLVCPTCRVYIRVDNFDGRNHSTVCACCGSPELEVVGVPHGDGEPPR